MNKGLRRALFAVPVVIVLVYATIFVHTKEVLGGGDTEAVGRGQDIAGSSSTWGSSRSSST